jgi:membrane associated rhomboid family serine protease
MIPIRDSVRSRHRPVVNYLILVLTAIAFFLQLQEHVDPGETLADRYGMVPRRVLAPDEPVIVTGRIDPRDDAIVRYALAPPPIPAWLTLLTSIFLHGGWLHFLGNMWFLYIFGDNVEDRLGRLGYLLFYLGTGVVAGLTHLVTNSESPIPTIGASGAIAGVMGAYFVLYPRATVVTVVPIFLFVQVLVLPAVLFLGVWFALQFFQGALSTGESATQGVAWWAHVGGFAAGLLVVGFLKTTGLLKTPAGDTRGRAEPFAHYRRGYGARDRW